MANLVRIKNLIREDDLNNVIIPVDKITYLDNAKQISISGLTDFVLSGFTGSTMIYKHGGYTTAQVGGIPVGFYMGVTGRTIQELFDIIFYSPTTTTTTSPTTTTTSTTPAGTTTTTTSSSTTTTSTTPAPTTTTTTTLIPISTFLIANIIGGDTVINNIKVGGISLSGVTFPIYSGDPYIYYDVQVAGQLPLEIYYTSGTTSETIMLGVTPVVGSACHNVSDISPYYTEILFPIDVNIYIWAGACF